MAMWNWHTKKFCNLSQISTEVLLLDPYLY